MSDTPSARVAAGKDPRKSKRERATWLQLVQYGAFRAAQGIAACVPIGVLYRVGAFLGRVVYGLDGRHRRIARRNVDLAYGDSISEAEKTRIVKEAFRSLVLLPLDVISIPRLLKPETIERYVEIGDLANADKAKERSKCCLYVTAHHGSWEVVAAALGAFGHPFHGIARPMRNRYINEYLLRSRAALGQKFVSKYGVMSELLRQLRAGNSLGFVADQDARHHGIFVDFFGIPSSTIPSPALLAYRFDVPILVGHCARIDWTFRFRVSVDGVLWPDTSRPRDEEVRRLTSEINRIMEGFIREDPGQYLWLHRRWKTRPEGEKGVYR